MGQLALSVVDDEREFAKLRSPWHAVFNSSEDRNVFLTWEWAHTWWRHFHGRDRLHVVVVREGSNIVAIAPIARDARSACSGAGCSLASARRPPTTEGVFSALSPTRPASLILDYLEERVARRHAVNLTRLRESSRLLSLLRRRFPPSRPGPTLVQELSEDYPCLDLTKTEDPAGHVSTLEKRNDVRRRLRRLRERHDVGFVYQAAPPRMAVEEIPRFARRALGEQR